MVVNSTAADGGTCRNYREFDIGTSYVNGVKPMTTYTQIDLSSRLAMLLILLALFLLGVRYAPSVASVLGERLQAATTIKTR